MKRTVVVFLFLVGMVATSLFGFYVVAFLLFVPGEGDWPGAIAFVPKWIFLFSFLILLKRRKEVQCFLGRLGKFFF